MDYSTEKNTPESLSPIPDESIQMAFSVTAFFSYSHPVHTLTPVFAPKTSKKGFLKYAKRSHSSTHLVVSGRCPHLPDNAAHVDIRRAQIVPKNVIGGSSDPPHPGRSKDLPGTVSWSAYVLVRQQKKFKNRKRSHF